MKRLFKGLLAGAVALAPIAAIAGIDGTHHDMSTYLVGEPEKCAFCHSVSLAGDGDIQLGNVGTFCYVVCHDGGQVANAVIDGPGVISNANFATAATTQGVGVLTGSHGLSPAFMPALDQAADIDATRWPHTNAAETGVSGMQCTSCHAVHDGTNPPFLNGPLSTGVNATSFCQRCHDGGAAAGTAGRFQTIGTMGAHPTEFANADAGTAGPGANGTKLGRTLGFKAPLVRQAAGNPVVATVADFDLQKSAAGPNKWKTGGHFMNATAMPTATTDGATFGCYSCHSAHQDNVALSASLILGNTNQARTNPANASSTLCVACHGATVADLTLPVDNPGDTVFTHPANENATLGAGYSHDHTVHGAVAANANIPAVGGFPVDVTVPAAYPVGVVDAEILCTSCHDVHGGVTNLMAIRQSGGGYTVDATNSMCLACHTNAAANPAGANWHHPTTATNYAAPWNLALGWATVDNLGDLSDGMNCPDCHVFQGTSVRRATAHNW